MIGLERPTLATIIAFPNTRDVPAPSDDRRSASSEVIVFPRTNIRVLRKLWGLPEFGLLVAGPDGRAVGALSEDTRAG
jgi:hypothetical protein